jgi:hypothetical protein
MRPPHVRQKELAPIAKVRRTTLDRSCAQNSTRARIKGLTLSRCPPPAPFEAGLAEGCIPIARYSCTTLAALETLNSIHCNTRPRRTPPPPPPAHRFELPLGQPRLWRDRASLTQRLEWWRAAYAARPLELCFPCMVLEFLRSPRAPVLHVALPFVERGPAAILSYGYLTD